jgi:hypothetical protein|tara:strand:- start:3163 stop:4182 length:1020 start_codon:yes stop_codon:yes gene_type:complete
MRFLKHTLLSLIIFSNTCFGKEFDKLFVVLEPIDTVSQIEKSINNSFNTMIYRLSGSDSPSNIWKIINAGNARKNFIKSYSIKNINNKSYLEVNFEKDLLIEVFNRLSIPILSNSRPIVLFLIEIDSGTEEPYYLTNSQNNSFLDESLKDYLKYESTSRGIFLELPEPDLIDFNQLRNYERLINYGDIINEKYIFDELIKINVSKTGIDEWSISGDINMIVGDKDFISLFIEKFKEHTNSIINKILKKNLINTSKKGVINISVSNINSFQDYEKSRKVLENLVGLRDIDISRFHIDTIFYRLDIFGDFDSIVKEISENNFLEIISQYKDKSEINMNFVK